MIQIQDPEEIAIYLPPDYFSDANIVYPVLYLFHGQWMDENVWKQIHIQETMDRLISDKLIRPFVIVMPREQAYTQDMYHSEFPNTFLERIQPFVESHYAVSTDPYLTAVGGISRGSLWAQYFSFMDYGRFMVVGVHSPPNAFFSFPKIYRIIQDHEDIPYLQIYIDIGNDDYQMRTGQAFSDQLTELFYPHVFHLNTGGHNEAYWEAHLQEYLIWYSDCFSNYESKK